MKVGDYCRTSNGNIFKIIGGNVDNYEIDIDYSKLEQTEENQLELYRYNDNSSFFNDKNIIKSSLNIIDLIKEGDLVNNHIVGQIFYENQTIDNIKYLDLEGVNILVCNDDIKSIVTKEQFKSMEYKVGEE